MRPTYLQFPFGIDGSGRCETTDVEDHVRQMIRLVLFTQPGERVNRPDFGCGIRGLVFRPNGEVLAGATRVLIQSALQKWLGDVIQVDAVEVVADDSSLRIRIAYARRETGERRIETFMPPAVGTP